MGHWFSKSRRTQKTLDIMRLPWPGLAALAAMTAMAGMARASASSVCEGTRTAAKVADGAWNVKVREDLAYVTGRDL